MKKIFQNPGNKKKYYKSGTTTPNLTENSVNSLAETTSTKKHDGTKKTYNKGEGSSMVQNWVLHRRYGIPNTKHAEISELFQANSRENSHTSASTSGAQRGDESETQTTNPEHTDDAKETSDSGNYAHHTGPSSKAKNKNKKQENKKKERRESNRGG